MHGFVGGLRLAGGARSVAAVGAVGVLSGGVAYVRSWPKSLPPKDLAHQRCVPQCVIS